MDSRCITPIFVCELSPTHDDVNKWKHFPRYWTFVRGIQWSPVDSPHKGQWRGALMCSLISAVEKTIETPVIWDAIALTMTSLQCYMAGSHNVGCKKCQIIASSFTLSQTTKIILDHEVVFYNFPWEVISSTPWCKTIWSIWRIGKECSCSLPRERWGQMRMNLMRK